jgi:hypothetical protein
VSQVARSFMIYSQEANHSLKANSGITASEHSLESRPESASPRNRLYAQLLLFALVLGLSLAALEIGARIFWRVVYNVPFRDPSRILYAFYPKLDQIDKLRPSRSDDFYNILFLGGSTLDRNWGEVEQALLERLGAKGYKKVRIFNLGNAAQTSRDSWLKYAALGSARFDLVILYDGINETRANNVPAGLFRGDYSHYSWYEVVNALAPYHGATSFALPYTLRYLVVRVKQTLMGNRYVPADRPREDWIQYGQTPRSAASFKQNVSSILELASRRADPVLLMTFATYVPKDYSLEAFKAKRLDYALHSLPLEIWGRPDHVAATVAVQNEIVRDLAGQHPGILFVDQAKLMLMDDSGRYFNDACHLTIDGSIRFVDNLLPAVLSSIKRQLGTVGGDSRPHSAHARTPARGAYRSQPHVMTLKGTS